MCSGSAALAMAAPWEDVLRDRAALREAAAVAVDAALLEGVLMRTEGEPNASDVSARASRDESPCGPGRAVSQQSQGSPLLAAVCGAERCSAESTQLPG